MSDRLASNSDKEWHGPVSRLLAPAPSGIRVANDRREASPNRHRLRQRRSLRSKGDGLPEALDLVAASSSIVCARSSDGALTFTLWLRPRGLVVERSELWPDDRRVAQSMLFASAHAFVTWCECDQLRFAYPMLFINLARSGSDLFDGTR